MPRRTAAADPAAWLQALQASLAVLQHCQQQAQSPPRKPRPPRPPRPKQRLLPPPPPPPPPPMPPPPKPRGLTTAGILTVPAAKLVLARFEAAEEWPETAAVPLELWERLKRHLAPEAPRESEEQPLPPTDLAMMPDGRLVPLADIADDDRLALVQIQAPGNNAKGARTIGGQAAPPPRVVCVAGPEAVGCGEIRRMVDSPVRGDSWYNPARKARDEEVRDEDAEEIDGEGGLE